ncbi:cell division protein DivIC [Scopulibacillus darangshiensis]|uniref:Cell division protein DivIC n=1 Tax=Scopulibacillus darangshiensis TaxID=442528 RepID=A0A4R2NMQ1_9BACL|nr:septum formation initiator family protein [Scopulibacillus darangshiensis]TCP22534.1 cell division protein DivIC [Scopulibacillus darangshiensis]
MKAEGRSRVAQIRPEYTKSKEIHEKVRRKRRKGLMRRLAAFAVLFMLIVGSMVSYIFTQTGQISEKNAQKEQLQQKLDDSKKQEAKLKHNIRLLHDKDYIGEIARRDFLLSKDGEIIFSQPDTDND